MRLQFCQGQEKDVWALMGVINKHHCVWITKYKWMITIRHLWNHLNGHHIFSLNPFLQTFLFTFKLPIQNSRFIQILWLMDTIIICNYSLFCSHHHRKYQKKSKTLFNSPATLTRREMLAVLLKVLNKPQTEGITTPLPEHTWQVLVWSISTPYLLSIFTLLAREKKN